MDTSTHRVERAPRHVVVVAGGDAPSAVDVERLDAIHMVIAADSGADTALTVGLPPDLVIGDLDSIDADVLRRLENAGATIDRHPPTKDAGDLELALDAAEAAEATHITVVGGGGGRLSHLLVNAALVAVDRTGVAVRWMTPRADVHVLQGGATVTVEGMTGDLVTLLPVGSEATEVTTTGLRWALDAATLDPGSSRGLSNELTGTTATVGLGDGTVLVIHERRLQ